VIRTSVGHGGVAERELGDPALTKAQLAHLRSRITIDDPERWTFVQPEVNVECELDSEWSVVVTVASQDGSPVVKQLDIRPRQLPPTISRGGLRTRAVRRLKLEDALAAARDALREIGTEDDAALRWHGFTRERLDTSPQKRRPSRYSDRYCAEVAAAYVDAIQRRCKPVRRCVAERMKRETGVECSEEHVRDVLDLARERELLSPGQHGVARGRLLPKGEAALSD